MIIKYDIVVTIVNLITNGTSTFTKTFETEINKADALLYNNYHVLSQGVYILDMFEDEVDAYCKSLGIEQSSVEVDEFEITSLTDRTDVFFESENPADNTLSLKPIIKCYVYPKNDALKVPNLVGIAYDSTTIIWSWPDDEQYAHYLVEEAIDPDTEADQSKIIAQLPVGATSYTETGLESDTPYTRRLINYTDEQTSSPSPSVTVMTETTEAVESLETYTIPKNYDFTTNDSEREVIQENLVAFHSGVGDFNDLKVYKQMDADFYQKFKAYFELTGRRIQREKRYDQVGFNYKICMEAMETVENQDGEVTFDVDVYPREEVTLQDYMWVTEPITIRARMTASVFLRKEDESTEPQSIVVYKPTTEDVYTEVVTETSWSNPTAVVISVDWSSSMRQATNGIERYKKTRNAVAALIDAIESEVNTVYSNKGETRPSNLIQYIIIIWGTDASVLYNGYDAAEAKEKALGMTYFDTNNGGYTCWYKGLTLGKTLVDTDRSNMGQIFFTDGFLNKDENGNYAFKQGMTYYDSVIASISKGAADAGMETYFVFGNGVNYVDTDYSESSRPAAITAAREIVSVTSQNFRNCYYPGDDSSMDNISEDELAQVLINGISIFESESKREQVYDHTEFTGWVEDDDNSETVDISGCEIDKVKIVTVTSDEYSFTIDASKTPVLYSRSEKRAIIPEKSFISYDKNNPTKITDKSVYDIIMDKVKQTEEWADGYNKTIGTVESNGEPDSYLIQGLHIEDTYDFGDEDEIDEANFGIDTWEDGLEGTINTYTDIDKAGTTTFGDDCYLVSKDNYFLIQGYTDAIIYDGTRFVTTELNYYDHASEILISASQSYNDLLKNRKQDSLTYSGSSPLNHVIDLIEIGKDIKLSGYNGLAKAGDYIEISPLTNDLVGSIDVVYESPILNYRFDIEDPDARTPLYEILPTCDPDSEYLNVVIMHVYYARNVWIMKTSNYVESFGDDPIATTSSLYIPLEEGLYSYTKKEWQDGVGNDNGKYIDEYIWFMSKKMMKTQSYHDELPGEGMDTFYGQVNGRYSSGDANGKKDLTVDTPQFNIPTTVDKSTIKIYIEITEFYPDTALVSYRWEHPYNNKDGITQTNGDYVYFSSDSLTYKDVEYYDIISTINMENQEVFDNKTNEQIYELEKPNTIYEYQNYYLKVTTDNGDVLALRYPTEISFDEDGKALVGVAFKGVVNATSQWAPRIHNGYYYLNQHEYFAYCEFDVEADFDTIESESFKTAVGYISFDVQLRHKASPSESYTITKDTRPELMQDEDHFQWVDGKGLTLKPFIEGEYYREYETYLYTSPVILFPNTLTTADRLNVSYYFEDGSEYLPMEVRSYDVSTGEWSEWTNFDNNTVPNVPLSCGYQVRFYLQASVTNTDLTLEDYMCCYLDWKDDMNEANTTNIVTITDHMTTGPDSATGIYVSRIIDFGCKTKINMDLFDSKYKKPCQLYIAVTDNKPDSLLLENIVWRNITNSSDTHTGRYLRYKIEIPDGEKVYWLHKYFITQETNELLPYVTGISMSGVYEPSDITENFINTESFEIPTDGEPHNIFDRVLDVIGADVLEKGYTESEIEYVSIQCTSSDITIDYDKNINTQYPGSYLNSGITATAAMDYDIVIKNTPYIFSEITEYGAERINITKGTPQQYCPITIEDELGNTYTQIYDKYIDCDICSDPVNESFMTCKEIHTLETSEKYIEMNRNDYEDGTLRVWLNDVELTDDIYTVTNHLIIFNSFLSEGDVVEVSYMIPYTFLAEIDRENDTTTLYVYTNKDRHTSSNTFEVTEDISGLTLYEMYMSGKRFSCNTGSTSMSVSSSEEQAWSYDRTVGSFIISINSSNLTGFVSTDICVNGYTHEATLKSDNGDDDENGIIVGYAYDENNEPHTLSFCVTRGGINIGGYALIYDNNRPTQKIIQKFPADTTMDPTFDTSRNWNVFPNGIRLRVEKHKNLITCQASMWNDPKTWNPKTLIEYDCDSNDYTSIFSDKVYYGYCNMSQNQSYYQDINFEAYNIKTYDKKYKVYFETSTKNNKFLASDLSLNPIYRTDYKGFIYLTDEHNEPYTLNIYCNPCRLKAGGYDKVDISVEILDILGNPVISKPVAVDCECGILNCEDYNTDMNGVIHIVYESAYYKATDTVTAKVLTDDGTVIQKSISIINE